MKAKYLIIGAGISGLAMANQLGCDYRIVEKEREPGGYCRTIREGDYVWDYAGHFFHFKTEKYRKLFLDNVDPAEEAHQNSLPGRVDRLSVSGEYPPA